jgi:hypothetical protein
VDAHYDPLGKLVGLLRGKTSANRAPRRGNGGSGGGER